MHTLNVVLNRYLILVLIYKWCSCNSADCGLWLLIVQILDLSLVCCVDKYVWYVGAFVRDHTKNIKKLGKSHEQEVVVPFIKRN